MQTDAEFNHLLVLDIKPDDCFPAGTASYYGSWYISHDRDIIRWMIIDALRFVLNVVACRIFGL